MERAFVFPSLARSWDPYARPRTMTWEGMGPLWEDLLNFKLQDGELKRRESLVDPVDASLGAEFKSLPLTTASVAADEPATIQLPRLIVDLVDVDEPRRLVVTTREIFLYTPGSGWANLTPTYTTGTCGVTNGSTAVTGSGTAWSDIGIDGGTAWLKVGSQVQLISSVTNNTNLVLAQNWGGSTNGTASYTIIRAFGPDAQASYNTIGTHPRRHFFFQVYDGDLYLAGAFGEDGDGCVFRYPNIYGSTAPVATDVEVLFSGAKDYTGSVDEVGETFYIFGLQIIETGQVVILGRVPGATPQESRIRWSDATDQALWTSGNSGSRDATSRGGSATGLGRLGFDLTLHYPDGIILAYLTGDVNAPLSYRPSRAEFGTISPMALKEVNGVEYFPSFDFNVRAFSGGSADVVNPACRKGFEEEQISVDDLSSSWAHRYGPKYEYRLFVPIRADDADEPDAPSNTLGVYVNYLSREVTLHDFAQPVGAAAEQLLVSSSGPTAALGDVVLLYGVSLANLTGSASYLHLAPGLEDFSEDTAGGTGEEVESSAIRLTTQPIDFLLAGQLQTVSTIAVFYRARDTKANAADSLTVSVSYDSGTTWNSVTVALDAPVATYSETFALFNFDTGKSGPTAQIRIAAADTNALNAALTSMIVWVDDVGDIRA